MPGDVDPTWRIRERRALAPRRVGPADRRSGEPRRASDRRDPHAPPRNREVGPDRRVLADRREAVGPRRAGGGRRVGEVPAYRRNDAEVALDPHPEHRPPGTPHRPLGVPHRIGEPEKGEE